MKIVFSAHSMHGDGQENGECDQIPYAKKIPPKAVTRSWEVSEDDGDNLCMV